MSFCSVFQQIQLILLVHAGCSPSTSIGSTCSSWLVLGRLVSALGTPLSSIPWSSLVSGLNALAIVDRGGICIGAVGALAVAVPVSSPVSSAVRARAWPQLGLQFASCLRLVRGRGPGLGSIPPISNRIARTPVASALFADNDTAISMVPVDDKAHDVMCMHAISAAMAMLTNAVVARALVWALWWLLGRLDRRRAMCLACLRVWGLQPVPLAAPCM